METQNVTFAVPKKILHELKLRATEQNISLTRYVISLMEKDISSQKEYEKAMRRNLERFGKYDLGTNGKIPWTREGLHERR